MSDVIFTAYIEPQPANSEWYRNVLKVFWQYGLRYHPYPLDAEPQAQALTWEEELQISPDGLYLGEGQRFQGTIAQWLKQVPSAVQGTIQAYDRRVNIQLTLQPNAQFPSKATHPLQRLGKIEMRYDEGYFQEEGPSSSDPVPRYLQVWYTIQHWAHVCCRQLEPLYACGFLEGFEPSEGYLYDKGEHDDIEQPLSDGKLPALERLIKYPMLQYISPQLINCWGVSTLLKQANVCNQNLTNGGVLQIRDVFPFHYGIGLAYNYLNLAREADAREDLDEASEQLYTVSGDLLTLSEQEGE
jgi:hypothetical protein